MLKELVVISGKGGTGKTSIVASLASLLYNKMIADCDVDAADLHLVLQPQILEKHEFWSGKTAFINKDKCLECGQCLELCRFAAINENFVVDKVSCEGCGVCVYFCPAKAINFKENLAGHWYISQTPYGTMVHAKLGIAEENSGKLVALVKNQVKKLALEEKKEFILVDGPPGIGCPVIASISGANLVLAVTEPTISGIHDLERVVALTKHFKINTAVCINKADINPEVTKKILLECREEGLEVLGIIPYDNAVTKAQVEGVNVVEFSPTSPAVKEIKTMAEKIKTFLKTEEKTL
ncbi:ATP-binding protein [Thermanaerosceptrum fracticalcis]|uniref:ATP-binding protein n=1 Tax=Thermanaerosceptrum fracticalcis TaxID=1712410 RepID=UPI000B21F067|nr:ATP-binding protein [Thermanaerosceptrum fracticalcis]